MKKIASLIIDDERLARVSLRKKLAQFPEIEIVGEAQGISSAIRAINELHPDLLFLDIQLSDGNGFELLEKIAYKGKVVFVTAYDEHALRAFEVNALDYLLKPVSVNKLKNLIRKLAGFAEDESRSLAVKYNLDDRIMVEQRGCVYFIQVSGIQIINSAKDYTNLVSVDNRQFVVNCSMREWEQKLPSEHFFRAHRASIVNINQIEKTIRVGATAEIYMKSYPRPVRVSRSYYKNLRDLYLLR